MTGAPGPARTFLDRDRLAGLTRAAFGRARRLTGVTRLAGGSRKGVYRLGFDDGLRSPGRCGCSTATSPTAR